MTSSAISQLLKRRSEGDGKALEQLTPLVYQELHRMAERYSRKQALVQTLPKTALIPEAYLRLLGQKAKRWGIRLHVFGVAAQAMRHMRVDYARARKTDKRGGEAHMVSLEEAAIVSPQRAAEV